MTTTTDPAFAPRPAAGLGNAAATVRPGRAQQFCRDRLQQGLAALRAGAVRFHEGRRTTRCGDSDGALGIVDVEVLDPRFWSAVALRGSLGAGEAWVQGHWRAADPVRLVRLLLRDRDVLDRCDGGLVRLGAPLLRLWHRLRANTERGSRRNIAAHYDLGNDFFAAFLDPSLTYSSAVFPHPGATLHDGQRHKLRRLCAKLGLGAGDRLLEIGTGWGSMALCAGVEFGARVTSTTISRRQLEVARARVAAAGLDGRVEVLDRDYRRLEGVFDKVVSVEMVEAVGAPFLPGFFAACGARLRPGGLLALQAITIADRHYAAALRTVDFIKRHVFPGSFIPSVQALIDGAVRGSDLRLVHLEEFGRHYAETLRRWRLQLLANGDEIRAAGYPEELLRTWEWYLAYCEGGFAERYLGLAQLVFARPGGAPPIASDLPAVTGDPYAA